MVYAGKRWSETLADCLLEMDFTPCKAEPDIWMRKKGDLYKYIASYLADLAIASKNPKEIIEELQTRHNFKSKGTGPITFYLGCDFDRFDDSVLCSGPGQPGNSTHL